MTDTFGKLIKNEANYFKSNELRKQRIGEQRTNIQGELMKIIEYRNSCDIDIMFMDTKNIVRHQSYSNFKNCSIIDRYLPTVFGVGIVGKEMIRDEYSVLNSYLSWSWMLKRCYHEDALQKTPSYKKCSVSEEWKYYKNYKKWYDEHFYKCGTEKMVLDKDILYKNNKIYCPQKCIFVPERINILFTKTDKNRGKYPIGVYYKKKNKKFVAHVSKIINDKSNKKRKQQQYLGLYSTPEEAFMVYKVKKEKYIKEIADMYKEKYENFPKDLYDALYNYEVEITD